MGRPADAAPRGASLAEESWPVQRAARNWVVLLCSIAALGVSTYLTIAHYSPAVTLVCSNNGAINCEKVTTSPQSIVFGIPVAVLGLGFYVAMTALSAYVLVRGLSPLLALVRLVLSVCGIGFVFYLLYAELFVIRAICLWCSSVHLLTFVIFCAVVTALDDIRWPLKQ